MVVFMGRALPSKGWWAVMIMFRSPQLLPPPPPLPHEKDEEEEEEEGGKFWVLPLDLRMEVEPLAASRQKRTQRTFECHPQFRHFGFDRAFIPQPKLLLHLLVTNYWKSN